MLPAFFSSKASSQEAAVTITAVKPDVLNALGDQANLGVAFVRRYGGEKAHPVAADIDAAIVAWRASADTAKEPADLVIERVGALFGAYLNGRLGSEWAVCSDARGQDFCVVHKKVSVYGFPHSAIYKAAVQGREEALPNVEAALVEQIAEALKSQKVMPR